MDIERPELIKQWFEPLCTASIITPSEYLKGVKTLCLEKRAAEAREEYMDEGRVVSLTYEIPFSELVTDFFDKLKSVS